MKKKNNQTFYKTAGFKPSKIVVIAILAGIVLIAAIAGLLYYRSLNRVVFDAGMVYRIDGIPYEFKKGDRAVIEKDGSVSIIASDKFTLQAEALPLYYKGKRAIMTVCPMSYYRGDLGIGTTGVLLDRFTSLEMINQDVQISYRKNQNTEKASFLYDGEDTYILLTEGTLNIGDDISLKLSALSYVIAVYDNYIMYYDYASDSFEYVTFDYGEDYKSVSVTFANGSVLNCDFDMFTTDNSSVMLPSAVSRLQNYF